jgi:hypothetical protein
LTVRRFEIHRDADVSGGFGVVADGVRLADGRAVVRWRGGRPSSVFWPCYEHAVAVHGHDGLTRFVDVGPVPEAEVVGVMAAVVAAGAALGMVFAGPCRQLHSSGALCVAPAGHADWPSLGDHRAEDGAYWMG